MTKDIKDFIHLYLGCEVQDYFNDKVGKLVRVSTTGGVKVLHKTQWVLGPDEFKLLLRPLSSMTNEETNLARSIYHAGVAAEKLQGEIEGARTLYLLSKGFDLFGLIEAGLALDKTKLHANETH